MPIPTGTPIAFECIEGRPHSLRVAVPEKDGCASFMVDQTRVWALLDSAAEQSLTDLRRVVEQAASVTVGALRNHDGDYVMHWLVSRKRSLLSRSRQTIARQGARRLLRCLPWLAGEIALAVWCFLSMMESFFWALMLVVVGIAFFITGIIAFSGIADIYLAWRQRDLLTQAQTALDEARTRLARRETHDSKRRAIDAPLPVTEAALTQDAGTSPRLLHLSGRVSGLQMTDKTTGTSTTILAAGSTQVVMPSSRTQFRCYQFTLAQRACILYVACNWADSRLFLAENDRVDIVVLDPAEWPESPAALVYGLHNLEDGTVYISHRIMRSGGKALRGPFPITGMTRRGFARARRAVILVFCLVALIFGCAWLWPGQAADAKAVSLELLQISIVILPSIWIVFFEIPMALWTFKWRRGYPSRRQRLTERVYALLGITSPRRPPAGVVEV